MSLKFTYKELLLVVGVIVALTIAAGFWLKAPGKADMKASFFTAPATQKTSSVSALSNFLEKSVPIIKF